MGFSHSVRSLTRAFLKPWDDYKRTPKDGQASSYRLRMKADRVLPMQMLYRVSLAAVDAGIPWAAVVAWADQYSQMIREYSERRAKRMGLVAVLPFPDRWARLNAKDAIEQGEAAAACWKVDGSDLDSLERARKELADEREVIDLQMSALDEKIAQFRSSASVERD